MGTKSFSTLYVIEKQWIVEWKQKIYMSFLAQFLALSSFHLIEADL